MYEINEINQYADRLYYGENDRQYYASRISSLAIAARFKINEMESDNNRLKRDNKSLEQDNRSLNSRVEQLENELLLSKLQLQLKEEYAKAGSSEYNSEKAKELRILISELKKYLGIEESFIDAAKEAQAKIEPYKIREEKERLAKERMDNLKASVKNFFFGSNEEEKAKKKVKTK